MTTSGFKLNHSMLRVKDPKKSLDFYQNTLGASLIETFEFQAMVSLSISWDLRQA